MTSHQILSNNPFDASVHPEAKVNDLDKDKIKWFVGLAREKRHFPLQYSEDNIRQILLSLHLMTEDNKIKNAALLLFAKDVQKWFVTATVKCAHFYGTKIQKPIISQQIYGGSVFEMVDMVSTTRLMTLSANLFRYNTTARWKMRMLGVKRNTTPRASRPQT